MTDKSKYQDITTQAGTYGHTVAKGVAKAYKLNAEKRDGKSYITTFMDEVVEENGGRQQWSDVQVIIDIVDSSAALITSFEKDSAKRTAAKVTRIAIIAKLIKLLEEERNK